MPISASGDPVDALICQADAVVQYYRVYCVLWIPIYNGYWNASAVSFARNVLYKINWYSKYNKLYTTQYFSAVTNSSNDKTTKNDCFVLIVYNVSLLNMIKCHQKSQIKKD